MEGYIHPSLPVARRNRNQKEKKKKKRNNRLTLEQQTPGARRRQMDPESRVQARTHHITTKYYPSCFATSGQGGRDGMVGLSGHGACLDRRTERRKRSRGLKWMGDLTLAGEKRTARRKNRTRQDKTRKKKKDGEGGVGGGFWGRKAEMQTRLVYCYVCRCGENKGQKGTD